MTIPCARCSLPSAAAATHSQAASLRVSLSALWVSSSHLPATASRGAFMLRRPAAAALSASLIVSPASATSSSSSSCYAYSSSRRTLVTTTTPTARQRHVQGSQQVGTPAASHSGEHHRHNNSGSASASASSSAAATAMGWSYDEVDAATGQTALDALYQAQLGRIQRILEQPLPPVMRDGHVHPDFFVGFGHYNYRLRDEYRAVLARELHVPVAAVCLSVAWSGRFDVSRFSRVQKVCGVFLKRIALHASDVVGSEGHDDDVKHNHDAALAEEDGEGRLKREEEEVELSEELQGRISSFIRSVNSRRSEQLLHAQLLQASEAIPEVEFAHTRRDHRLLTHMHAWMHSTLLKQSLAVIVYGGDGSTTLAMDAHQQQGSAVDAALRARRTADAEETARQLQFVERRWVKSFHSRRTVPCMLPLTQIASSVARAVVAGDVAAVKLDSSDYAAGAGDGGDDALLLPRSIQALLQHVKDAAHPPLESEPAADAKGGSSSSSSSQGGDDDIFANEGVMAAMPLALQRAAAEWMSLVQHALFIHEGGASFASSVVSSTAARDGKGDAVPTAASGKKRGAGADEDKDKKGVGASSAYTSTISGQLPALFVHGAYAGGLREMRYLQSNKAAMDALLLHPNDITMKKTFVSRMRNGHNRLRMHEEIAGGQHDK